MTASVGIALQVVLTAQIFLLGLASNQFQSEVVGRLRQHLDSLRAEMQAAAYGGDASKDLIGSAAGIGGGLEDLEERLLPAGLGAQILISVVIAFLVFAILILSAIAAHVPLISNPLWNVGNAGGYLIALAALVAPISVIVQFVIARRYLFDLRDRVLAAAVELPEVRIRVVEALASPTDRRMLQEAAKRSDVPERFRATGDPQSNVIACEIMYAAVKRAYSGLSGETVHGAMALSQAYAEVGRFPEALRRAREAFDDSKSSGGSLRLEAAVNLCYRLVDSDELPHASDMLVREMEHTSHLSPQNPILLDAKICQFSLLAECRKYDEALNLADEVVAEMEHVPQPDSPSLIRAKMNQAAIKSHKGMVSAIEDLEQIVARSSASFGQDHVVTIEAKLVLAQVMDALGKSGAVAIVREVHSMAHRLLGDSHRLTFDTLALLAEIEGATSFSVDERKRAIARCQHVFGADHSFTKRLEAILEEAPKAESEESASSAGHA